MTYLVLAACLAVTAASAALLAAERLTKNGAPPAYALTISLIYSAAVVAPVGYLLATSEALT